MDLRIDISDWADEVNMEEVQFDGIDDLLHQHVASGWTPLKAGRLAIAARHLGRANDDILPENKLLLNSGAAVEVSRAFASRTKTVMVNEQEWDLREFVGSLAEDAEQTIVAVETDEATRRAVAYLGGVVPGHIESRLLIIAMNGGDVKAAADGLHERIDAIVEAITEPK